MTPKRSKAFVFDLDHTLFTTAAKELGQEDTYKEFYDKQLLLLESSPLPLFWLARQAANEGHDVYILTARPPEVKETIHTLLSLHGLENAKVITAGDCGLPIHLLKAAVLDSLAPDYDVVYFYDDTLENISAVSDHIRTFHVQP